MSAPPRPFTGQGSEGISLALEQHHSVAQFDGTPRRRFYTGGDIARIEAIADIRARTHRLMPRFVLEYLEGVVAWIFMELRMRDGLQRFALSVGFVWPAILFVLLFADTLTRGWLGR